MTIIAAATLTLIAAAGIAPDVTAARRHKNRNARPDGHPLGPRAERIASQSERSG